MTRAKPKSVIQVAEGSGGMARVENHRFKPGWPISFQVPTDEDQADDWLRYFAAELHRRGWSASGIDQLDRKENSGSRTVSTGPGNPQFAIRWERRRGGPLKIDARPIGSPEIPLPDIQDFVEAINQACRSRATEKIYARGTVYYQGLAWRGGLWLDDDHRLAPPSRQDETALIGPRVVHLDVRLDCIGAPERPGALRNRLHEMSAFLKSVVMGKEVRLPPNERAWTWEIGARRRPKLRSASDWIFGS
ncbi:MAG TPA: hypothetical protein VJY34_21510 [Roseiarcus sp.]|nr:hypothetical protein [Roseiarcus sp.]